MQLKAKAYFDTAKPFPGEKTAGKIPANFNPTAPQQPFSLPVWDTVSNVFTELGKVLSTVLTHISV